ncbi:MAG: RNA polymerase sigma factor [Actinobacteria bacterium]|nr:RNA polymerase sigma factor [Actinomycetota bacterium]
MDTQTRTGPSTGNTSEDGALVRAALGGDKSAMDLLIERHRPRLVAFCRRRTRDRDLAEDLAQEVLLRALAHLESFDTRRAMWPWLKHIAANLAIDHERKHCRETVGLPDAEAEAEVEVEVDPLAAIDERCLVDEALKDVPARQVAALELYYFEDWSATEAAAFFDTNRRAMQQLLHRARNSFKVAYEHTGGRVAGGFALPFGARIRELVDRARARVGAWEASLQTAGAPFSAATAGIVAAATLTTAGMLPQPPAAPAHPSIDSPSYALAAQHTAVVDHVLSAGPQEVAYTDRLAAASTLASSDDPTEPETVHRFSFTAPDGAVLGDPTDADADVERDEHRRSLNYQFERRLPAGPGDTVRDDANVVTVYCEGTGATACDAVDGLPDQP